MGNSGKDDDQDPELQRLTDKYLEARTVLEDLLELADATAAARRKRALQEQRVWSWQALMLQQQGLIPEASKASAEAIKLGLLAVNIDKASLADRVSLLEARVDEASSAGGTIRELARSRRR